MSDLAKKISEAELTVLELLWEANEPLPVTPIRIQLGEKWGWDASTVKTLLRRLCEKGAVKAEKRDVFYYHPLLSREEYQSWSTGSLVERIYRGSARDLVASLVAEKRLTQADLEELREILYPKEGGNDE